MTIKPIRLSPCTDCPFRYDRPAYPTRGRVLALEKDLTSGNTFLCHKTLDYNADDEGPRQTRGTQTCAGAAIMLERMGQPNQAMQIAERLGLYAPADLD